MRSLGAVLPRLHRRRRRCNDRFLDHHRPVSKARTQPTPCPSYKFRPVQKSWSFRVMPDSVGGMPTVLLHGVVSASQLRLLP